MGIEKQARPIWPVPAGAQRIRSMYVKDGQLVIVFDDDCAVGGDAMPYSQMQVSSGGSSGQPAAVTGIPFNKRLAAAGVSESLFTIPAGQVGVMVDARIFGNDGDAIVALVPGVAATVANGITVSNDEAYDRDGLALPAGTYQFVGPAGKRPSIRGVVWVANA